MLVPPALTAWNTTLLFVHVPKTGGTAIESAFGALERRAPGADSAVHRRVPRCLGDDARSWGLGVHLPEPEALEGARRCAAVRGPIVSFAVVRDVGEVARSAWLYLQAHPSWTPEGAPSCRAFQAHRYSEARPKGAGHRHTFTYAQHTFLGPCTVLFSYARGTVWPFLTTLGVPPPRSRVNAAHPSLANGTRPCPRPPNPQDVALVRAVDAAGVVVPACAPVTRAQRAQLEALGSSVTASEPPRRPGSA